MHYPDKDNRTQEIIEEIQKIQSEQYSGWIAAMGRQLRVDKLHAELDKMGYGAERPPRQWSHFKSGK